MRLLAALVLLAVCLTAQARDPAKVREFRKTHACPATGKTTGACAGWVVDHHVPLCLQPLVSEDLDVPENMGWQEHAESLRKDKIERELCARLKRTDRQ
jgi:hypothetical protein